MASDIDICNLALLRLGTRSSISSLSETSAEAAACAMLYPVVRDSLLTRHQWGFATRRVALADLGNPPSPWAFRYAYPTDCLQARALHQPVAGGPLIPFAISGDQDGAGNPMQVILSDQPQAELVYTARITSAALFDAAFVEALSWLMAGEMGIALTGDRGLATYCMQAAGLAIASAKANDANEVPEVRDRTPEFITARGTA
jgi:hypothetical protein